MENQHVEQNLDVTLGLHEAAHDAVDGMETVVVGVGDHGGNDGVVGSFVRCEDVGVVGSEGEIRAAVLKREAASRGDDACAKAAVVGDYETTAVAVGVGDGEVDGVGGAVRR